MAMMHRSNTLIRRAFNVKIDEEYNNNKDEENKTKFIFARAYLLTSFRLDERFYSLIYIGPFLVLFTRKMHGDDDDGGDGDGGTSFNLKSNRFNIRAQKSTLTFDHNKQIKRTNERAIEKEEILKNEKTQF